MTHFYPYSSKGYPSLLFLRNGNIAAFLIITFIQQSCFENTSLVVEIEIL